ncbi:hypothetical protein OBV_16370 [Oscillibacter valericigenes Sjm18-20]|nr:hypothetical protein OBV_16370 [Oscillibacter valericigenes Sjm18-20]
MNKKLTMDDFLEALLIMLIVAAIAVIGNWVSGKFTQSIVDSIPGMLILLGIAILGTLFAHVIPLKIPAIIYITVIGILLAIEGSPTAPYVTEAVGKVGLLPLATPVLAYAGVNMGKDWAEFKKIGWKGIVVTLCVMIGTFVGSALIAQLILSAEHII